MIYEIWWEIANLIKENEAKWKNKFIIENIFEFFIIFIGKLTKNWHQIYEEDTYYETIINEWCYGIYYEIIAYDI